MSLLEFEQVIRDASGGNAKVQKGDYVSSGQYPIIDQGQDFIGGYTDDESCLVKGKGPWIVFGDHTRALKYVDFPFCMGADGVKVLSLEDASKASLKYVYHFLHFSNIPSAGYSRHYKFLKRLSIPLPPLDEQKRIAAILDKADQLRQKRRQAITMLDSLTKSIFLEMFGDPISNPMQWPSSTLIEACIAKSGIKAGPFGSALKKEDYQTSGFRVYGQEQVIAGSLKIGNYYISEQKYQSLRSCAVDSGDVLLSLVGSFGKCLIVPEQFEEGIINPRLLRIRLMPKKMSSIFLKALITSNSIQSLLFSNSRGGTMGILNAGIVKNIPIVLPPIELQKGFALRIAKLLTLEDEAHEGKKSIDLLFSSLQHRAFSGHL